MTGLSVPRFLEDAAALCSVPAPTGREAERGLLFARLLEAEGVRTGTDEAGNVVGELPGSAELPCVVVAAHLDTVFPELEPIEVQRGAGWLAAPGIGDNSAGVAALLVLARELPREGLGRILLVGTVGEEGTGDLRGARFLLDRHGTEVDVLLAVEGLMLDEIVTAGVGSERLLITVRGPGGHSWGDAGRPSAILGAAELVRALYRIKRPDDPVTTLEVGTIQGGLSVNSIAAEATLTLDLRSTDSGSLSRLLGQVGDLLSSPVLPAKELTVEWVSIGSRPAGGLPPEHPLAGRLREARREAGLPPAREGAASTDANAAHARGIPAATIGVGRGQDPHLRSERLYTMDLDRGLDSLVRAVRNLAVVPLFSPGSPG